MHLKYPEYLIDRKENTIFVTGENDGNISDPLFKRYKMLVSKLQLIMLQILSDVILAEAHAERYLNN